MTENRCEGSFLRRTSLRAGLYAPLMIGIVAGSACAGIGTGSAAITDTGAVAESTSSASDPQHGLGENLDTWYLKNATGQPIYGEWSLNQGSGQRSYTSKIQIAKPGLQDGMSIKTGYDFPDSAFFWNPDTYAVAHICFNHVNRNLNNLDVYIRGNRGFTLVATPNADPPSLSVQWTDGNGKKHEAPLDDNLAEGRC
ncbi:hypothetical protein [Rhodococcus jostii]|uniref:hypothetical protein n=1 Tax=Rhodococcus jostii TaxID=132919 RepID=UPI00362A553D